MAAQQVALLLQCFHLFPPQPLSSERSQSESIAALTNKVFQTKQLPRKKVKKAEVLGTQPRWNGKNGTCL
ncbi:hypothetical protein EDM59_27310 [Brevibacillus nitrificans]|uniref:Uncharacterized protein n=1 Tax=Brevibacillus nitrificans TaxID=651560 RepID=A0A3M8CUN1_9BACL|nr:hypothetical protein EDM59_27310 [Brevibacillus nitrificans]